MERWHFVAKTVAVGALIALASPVGRAATQTMQGGLGPVPVVTSGRLDIRLSQLPTSPVIRQGNSLTAITPRDANLNPADALIGEEGEI